MQVGYEKIRRELTAAGVETGAAELHGLLCGMLCAGTEGARELWLGELFDPARRRDPGLKGLFELLDRLLRETAQALEGEEAAFPLLLPDDERPLKERATAVRDWCQGFVYGLGLTGALAGKVLSAQGQEVIRDLSEFTRMEVESLVEDEEEEEALMQITEFLWVATTLLRDELQSAGRAH